MSFSASVEALVRNSSSPLVAAAPTWTRVQLSKIARIVNGYPWKSEYFNERSGPRVIRIRDVSSGSTDTHYSGPIEDGFWINNGDLLVGMDGDFNSRIWNGGRALLNQRVCKIIPNEQYYLTKFLAAVLPGYLKLINDETHSVTVKHLSSKTLADLPLPLPSLAEQRRIVAKIDSLAGKSNRAREQLDRLPLLVKKYKQALLAAAFNGDLTHKWRLAQPNIRQQWRSVLAETLFSWSSGKNLPTKKMVPGTIPVIGGNGVSGYHNKFLISHDTLVIGRVGAQCGNVHLSQGPAWVTDNAIYATAISADIDLQFAIEFLRSQNLNSLAGGSGQPYVNQAILNESEFPLPALEEQREIIRRIHAAFSWIDRLASETTNARKLMDHLDQGILAKAFRGELVPLDPDDEPATALLDQIMAERAPIVRSTRLVRRARATLPVRTIDG